MNKAVDDAKEEVRVERLKREEETVMFESRVAILEAERLHFSEEKNRIEEAAKRVN